ncbi:DUF3108 domain-containing protein [Undibacterium griseum]|uniref:DUF3108 domain-containing protein n=1 Tax=Undibacterium griseum TaxID=2762295 RepID=A0ABR6YP80_9BURK|nr:DUF3108 domain-containing protein [Undibacterium griseum]MBC3885697.1 DUF3108 domain-containing protein [Undibacterium griseum]
MTFSLRLHSLLPAILLSLLSQSAFCADHAASVAAKSAFSLPPPVELQYSIRARQSGIPLSGSASVKWQWHDKSYQIQTETRAMLLGKILDASSQGTIDEYGLAPEKFIEKRLGKPPTTTSFERDSKTLRFSASEASYALKGGEQDRTSATWQLVALARAAGDKFRPGSEWKMFVAGRRDAEPWSFKVIATENLSTALGDFSTVHITKAPPPDSKDQQLDIWLAPALDWYPVRLKFSDASGEFVDQLIESKHPL